MPWESIVLFFSLRWSLEDLVGEGSKLVIFPLFASLPFSNSIFFLARFTYEVLPAVTFVFFGTMSVRNIMIDTVRKPGWYLVVVVVEASSISSNGM